MQTPQTIAIIGIGAIGKGIAGSLFAGNDNVLLFDKDADKAQTLAAGLQLLYPTYAIEAIQCSMTGVWEADLIILDIPTAELQEVAAYI